jgi:hypothetical protein
VPARLTYANVVATLALFVSLGGGAYAAITLPAGSVGTRQLKNQAVTPAKLSHKTKALLKRGPRGATGARGATGTPGATGAAGPTGPSEVYAAGTAFLATLPATETSLGSMTVPAGSYVLEAKVSMESPTGGGSDSECTLGGPFGSSIIWDQGSAQHNANSDDVISLLAVATFTAPQVVELDCRAISGTVAADDARVIATATGALHGTTPVD